jgi:hypothetical protein
MEGNSVKITAINLGGLQRLYEEFGFTEFSLKLCRFFEGSEDSKEAQLGSSLLECKVQF